MSVPEDGRPSDDWLVAAVGAAIFASDEPVPPGELGKAFGEMSADEVESVVRSLEDELERGRTGLRVERVAGGFRLATRPEVGVWVRQYMRQRNRTRLSSAAIETLAIIAYRQPVTAPEIQSIRGRDPAAALKTLLDKKLIRPLGRKKVVGNPLLYGTSRTFLIHFGLDSLRDLPSMEEFGELVGLGLDETSTFLRAPHEGSDAETTPAPDGDSDVDDESAPGRDEPDTR